MAHPYDAQSVETEPLIQRRIGRVAGFQIREHVLLVALFERFRFLPPKRPLLEVPVFSGKGIVPSLKTVGNKKVKCKR